MAKKAASRAKGTLKYPQHAVNPQDFLTFVELDEFIDDWKDLGLNQDQDLFALQVVIMANPMGSPVIQGTGGLRKIRFAREGSGKSCGVRVCYVYFDDCALVLLIAAYDHNEQDNLSAEQKKGIREYIKAAAKWLSERAYT